MLHIRAKARFASFQLLSHTTRWAIRSPQKPLSVTSLTKPRPRQAGTTNNLLHSSISTTHNRARERRGVRQSTGMHATKFAFQQRPPQKKYRAILRGVVPYLYLLPTRQGLQFYHCCTLTATPMPVISKIIVHVEVEGLLSHQGMQHVAAKMILSQFCQDPPLPLTSGHYTPPRLHAIFTALLQPPSPPRAAPNPRAERTAPTPGKPAIRAST